MQIPGGVIMGERGRIAEIEKRVSALESVVEKFTSTNSPMPKCLCLSCSRLLSNGGTCQPNTNSFVTACGGYSGTSA
jgi:hypothetical protein